MIQQNCSSPTKTAINHSRSTICNDHQALSAQTSCQLEKLYRANYGKTITNLREKNCKSLLVWREFTVTLYNLQQ